MPSTQRTPSRTRPYRIPALRYVAAASLALFAFVGLASFAHRLYLADNTPQQLSSRGQDCLRVQLSGETLLDSARPGAGNWAADARDFYTSLGGALAWIRADRPTAQANQLIEELEHAERKGLSPDDYDGPVWPARLSQFAEKPKPSEDALIAFDVALTISAMRYLSDLHVGRVPPESMHFAFSVKEKSLALPEFLATKVLFSDDVHSAVAALEPQFLAYQRTLDALDAYRKFALLDQSGLLPPADLPVAAGADYSGAAALANRLRILGDLPSGEDGKDGIYSRKLAGAVQHFQARHGLETTGQLDSPTLHELNVPLTQRVSQLELTLERWRWLPQNYTRPPLVVNIPEFRLYATDAEHHTVFSMNIVVGRAYRHKTPVFHGELRTVVFRPYWNVPLSILREEAAVQIAKDPDYLVHNSFEIVDDRGVVHDASPVDPSALVALESGRWHLRQKPGDENSLGLLKFEFPNPYDVYLHGTPAQELFAKSRRDFSHGCIRVEDPAALAAWVLRQEPGWTQERILMAMHGEETLAVPVHQPIPVWILYGTAVVHEDGQVFFLNDIYAYDAALRHALEEQKSVH